MSLMSDEIEGYEEDGWTDPLSRLTGSQKAAIFLLQMGKERTAKVLQAMRDTEVEELMTEIALVLAHMHPDHAAMVMGGLPEQLQSDVAMRVATMDRTSPEVISQVEQVLERRLSSVIQSSDMSAAGGVQPLVDILNRSDRATERLILEGLETKDPELAEEVRSRMFVFEDITTLDDRSVQLVLREVDAKQLAVALKGVRDDVRNKIMRNMSTRASTNLAEEIDLLGPVRLKTVEEAQGDIVRVIRALEEAGQIVITRGAGGDEFVV